MTFVAQSNLYLLVAALLVGLIVGWWMFRRGRAPGAASEPVTSASPPPPPPVASNRDTREGNRLQDEVAAATTDVAGEIIGVRAHAELPGASGPPNDLQMLKGVGPRLAAQLNEAGISRFDQLAGLGETEVAMLDARMGAFAGRIARDRLVEQACYLARDDRDGFEAKFGKLGGAG
jgi:predicted flap endonuclease-1-like 5' DNA nuclease